MKRITINNYQYYYDYFHRILYSDFERTVVVDIKKFTSQEREQFYNQINYENN